MSLSAEEDREVDRLWRLARSHDVWAARVAATENPDAWGVGEGQRRGVHMSARPGEEIGWREVLLGRRFDTRRTEELDRKDMERGECLGVSFLA